jgi:hypothetical protein
VDARNKDFIGLAFAELTHGVTNVKRWVNDTAQVVEVWKVDGGSGRADNYTIRPGTTFDGDMWIPWANTAEEYRNHHVTITVGGSPLVYIWQNGDSIRFNTDDAFIAGGPPLAGGSGTSGGNRTIAVGALGQDVGVAIGGFIR